MDLISADVARHLDALVPERHRELLRMEAVAVKTKFPIIGPASGQLCYVLTRLAKAKTVFELGSGFGYSTAWFAMAVRDNGGGTVHHVVWDEELSDRASLHLNAMGLQRCVQFHVGEAVEVLRTQTEQFDVVFNDIDKEGYPAALDVIEERIKPGGLLITDNGLWSGRIFDEKDQSKATVGVREFTKKLTTSPNWSTSLIPIRDGLFVAVRR